MKKKKRLFIDVDSVEAGSMDARAIQSCALNAMYRHGVADIASRKEAETFYDTIIDDALGKMPEVIKAIVECDEVYAQTALIPRYGSGDFGSPMLFNGLMHKAIELKITGKDIYIHNELKNIWWSSAKPELLRQAFANNRLFVEDGEDGWAQVDIEKLIAEEL